LKQLLKEKGMIVAGGQGHLKGKIIRISHLGYYDEQDLLAFFSTLEDVLGDLDWPCQPGVAVAKFREVVAKWEKNWG
jgi:aspartate aminotransferase-like enzyme